MSRSFSLFSLLSLLALFLSSCTSASDPPATSPVDLRTETPIATASVEAHPTSTTQPSPTITLADPTPAPGGIDPNEIVTLLPRDAIPAIWDPQPLWATIKEAEQNGDITDEIDVIGLAVGGEARAYPIPFLSAHEIVNDNVGGTAIAVTW